MTAEWVPGQDESPVEVTLSSRVRLERRCALFLVVLCALCCVWVHEGVAELELRVADRRAKLEALNRMRSSIRDPARATPDPSTLDGLFPSMRVALRNSAAGPYLALAPAMEPGEE